MSPRLQLPRILHSTFCVLHSRSDRFPIAPQLLLPIQPQPGGEHRGVGLADLLLMLRVLELLGLEVMLRGRPSLPAETNRVRGEVGEAAVGFVDAVEVDNQNHATVQHNVLCRSKFARYAQDANRLTSRALSAGKSCDSSG